MTVRLPDTLSFVASRSADVLVVGAGPAGLAAAAGLAAKGASVIVLDRDSVAGGMPRWCAHSPFGMREFKRILSGASYGDRLVERATKAGAEIVTGHSVLALEPGAAVVASPDGPKRFMARRIVLATGGRETSRAGRLIAGERPNGIMNTGALQYFVHRDHQALPFRRPVIIGSELVALSAMLTLRKVGIKPVALVETWAQPLVRKPFSFFPALNFVPVHLGCEIVGIIGARQVEGLVIRKGGREETISCDGIVLSGRFIPEASLARMSGLVIDPGTQGPIVDQFGRTSSPHVFAAGNVLRGVETAGWCWHEGGLLSEAIAADLAGKLPAAVALTIRAGAGVSLVMPQKLVRKPGGLDAIQVRVNRFGKGRLILKAGSRTLWKAEIDSGPERRILIPVGSWVEEQGLGELVVSFGA